VSFRGSPSTRVDASPGRPAPSGPQPPPRGEGARMSSLRYRLRCRARPEGTLELADDAAKLEREHDLRHAAHERERCDQREQRDRTRAGLGEHDHAEGDREQSTQPEQERPPPADRQVEGQRDLEDAEGDRPRRDGVQEPERREAGPDEDENADRDSEQASITSQARRLPVSRRLKAPAIVATPETSAKAP